jgi:hypothetical protein
MRMAMNAAWHVGRKEIIEYLRPYLDLPERQQYAWRKILRWRQKYGLPIEPQPNGKPFIDEVVFRKYWAGFRKKRNRRASNN